MCNHFLRLPLNSHHQTWGIKPLRNLLRAFKIRVFIQHALPEIPIKRLNSDFEYNRRWHLPAHRFQMLPVHPVCFKKQLLNLFLPNNLRNFCQCLLRQFKAASGINHLKRAKLSGYMRKHLPVQLHHRFFIPPVVVNIIAECAFSPRARKRTQQTDLPLILFCNPAVTLLRYSHFFSSILSTCSKHSSQSADTNCRFSTAGITRSTAITRNRLTTRSA